MLVEEKYEILWQFWFDWAWHAYRGYTYYPTYNIYNSMFVGFEKDYHTQQRLLEYPRYHKIREVSRQCFNLGHDGKPLVIEDFVECPKFHELFHDGGVKLQQWPEDNHYHICYDCCKIWNHGPGIYKDTWDAAHVCPKCGRANNKLIFERRW